MSDVTSYHITGDWRHIIDDGMVDLDALPDETLPNGHIILQAVHPDIAQAGDPTIAYTLATITATITAGILHDNQDREGIWLPGKVGDTQVTWRATTHLWHVGQPIDYPVVEFTPTDNTILTSLEATDTGYQIATTQATGGVESFEVTGDWRHLVDDGMVDLDALPDEVLPTGHVRFTPVWPKVATSDGVAFTFSPITGIVAAGELRDLQGRAGVWLPAGAGVTPVLWEAETHVQYQGEALDYPLVQFQLGGPVRLTGLYEDGTVWPAPVVTAVEGHRQAAESAAERAEQDRQGAEDAAEQTGLDRVATGEDRTATGLDRTATGEDREQTGLDRAATGEDRTAVADDRVQTGQDRQAAGQSATDAASSATAAQSSAAAALSDADRAETAADAFGLSATTSTGAPGSDAEVTVTGDGPAYGLDFTIPRGVQGPKGDPGEVSQAALDAAVASLVDGAPEALNTLDELATALGNDPNFATTVSTQIGQRALIDGAPEQYDSLGKLVSALIAGELGGSTDAGVLTGALTDQVDASEATVESDLNFPGGPGVTTNTVAGWVSSLYYMSTLAMEGLDSKADVGHSHTISDVSGLEDALDGKADTAHTHAVGDVSGLQDALDDTVTGDGISAIQRVTQAEYDNLTPDPDTLYVVVD